MTTFYTREMAIARANERALQDDDTYVVYQHKRNKNDFIVKNAAAARPSLNDWKRIYEIRTPGHGDPGCCPDNPVVPH